MSDAILLHPPLCDFTRPPADLPTLKAACAQAELDVHCVDANLRAVLDWLEPQRLAELVATTEARISGLSKRTTLNFWEQQELVALSHGFADGLRAQHHAADALETTRTRERFFTRDAYQNVVTCMESVLALVSGVSFPFDLTPTVISAPFSVYSADAVARFEAIDPFRKLHEKILAEASHSEASAIVVVLSEASQWLPALAFAAFARRSNPALVLVAAGPLIEQWWTASDERTTLLQTTLHQFFDAICTLDAEQQVPEVLAGAKAKKLKTLAGVLYRDVPKGDAKKPTGRAKAYAAADLAELPEPDFSDLSLSDYPLPEKTLSYRPSRGRLLAPHSLSLFGLSLERRMIPAELAATQIVALAEKHEARYVQLVGDSVTPAWLDDFSRALDRATVRVRFSALLSLSDTAAAPDVAPVQAESAAAWRQAGCVSLCLAMNEHRAALPAVGRSIDALAHAQIAVQMAAVLDWPGESEERAKELVQFMRSHHQQVDVFFVPEASDELGARLSAPRTDGAVFAHGDESPAFALNPRKLPGAAVERLVDDVDRLAGGYQLRRFPLAGSICSTHTLLGLDRFGRRVFAQPARQAGAPTRQLSDGERIRLSEDVRMLWIPYQLQVLSDIGLEEEAVRSGELGRKQQVGAEKVWAYSLRDDLKLRANQARTPHVLVPGMPAFEISMPVADLLALATEQAVPASQLLAKVPRENRETIKRQLIALHAQGAIVTEAQARAQQQPRGNGQSRGDGARHGGQQASGGNGGHAGHHSGGGNGGANNGGGGDGQGRRRRRRRRGRGGQRGGEGQRMGAQGGNPPPT